MPKTSGTAQVAAQSSTCTRGVGEVSRLATNASITWPWVARAMSRTGQARSTMPAMSNRRQNSATTGKAPSAFSTLGRPYRTEVRIQPFSRLQPDLLPGNQEFFPEPTGGHVRNAGLAAPDQREAHHLSEAGQVGEFG